jgi:phage tail-like protein
MTEQTKSRYLEYLPAIYHEDDFVGQFLLPFEGVLTGFEELLSTIDRYFAPALTDPEFVPWLANWVALVLDEEWDETKRRRFIGEAVELYRWRGTIRGLNRYLEIYTGLVPGVRERRWPGGIQIGVASRIGGPSPEDEDAPARIPPDQPEHADQATRARIQRMVRQSPVYHDYYVVDTVAPDDHPPGVDPPAVRQGQPLRLYYRADRVTRVDVDAEAEEPTVDICYFPPGAETSVKVRHQPATVTRRDGLIDERYTLGVSIETETGIETIEYNYGGDMFLIEELELPYCFIVDVRGPAADVAELKLDKVRTIIDLEKPAHTVYYLKRTPVVSEFVWQPMQIAVRSTIEVDTTIG